MKYNARIRNSWIERFYNNFFWKQNLSSLNRDWKLHSIQREKENEKLCKSHFVAEGHKHYVQLPKYSHQWKWSNQLQLKYSDYKF